MREKFYIYTLSCPITNEVRYVGVSINPQSRLGNHISGTESIKEKAKWINDLMDKKLCPILDIIDYAFSKKDAHSLETEYILSHSNKGSKLFNAKKNPNLPNPRRGIEFHLYKRAVKRAEKMGISVQKYLSDFYYKKNYKQSVL